MVGKIFISYPILNLLSLPPHCFINNNSIQRCMNMLNLYSYRIFLYDMASIFLYQMTCLQLIKKGKADGACSTYKSDDKCVHNFGRETPGGMRT
jgi:hypothetical protein